MPKHKSSSCAQSKVHKVMNEYKHHTLKGGVGKHPKVHSRGQAVAIALSEARKECGKRSVRRK